MYTQDMERLAEGIKEKNLATHNRIKNDEANVNRIGVLAASNNEQAKQRNDSLREMVKSKSKSSLCLYSLILFATIIFFMMFAFIKIFPK